MLSNSKFNNADEITVGGETSETDLGGHSCACSDICGLRCFSLFKNMTEKGRRHPTAFSVCSAWRHSDWTTVGVSSPITWLLSFIGVSLTSSDNYDCDCEDPRFLSLLWWATSSITRSLFHRFFLLFLEGNTTAVLSADKPHICIFCGFVFLFTFEIFWGKTCLAWCLSFRISGTDVAQNEWTKAPQNRTSTVFYKLI